MAEDTVFLFLLIFIIFIVGIILAIIDKSEKVKYTDFKDNAFGRDVVLRSSKTIEQ